MFCHDPRTNRLSLRLGQQPPWLRKETGMGNARLKDRSKTWLYCPECKDRYSPDRGQRERAFVPYRDKASQFNLRAHQRLLSDKGMPKRRESASQQNTQPEPEQEPDETGCETDKIDVQEEVILPMEDDDAEEGQIGQPVPIPDLPAAVPRPTLEEYKKRWADKLSQHANATMAPFSWEHLVPKVIPQLWQDCRPLCFF